MSEANETQKGKYEVYLLTCEICKRYPLYNGQNHGDYEWSKELG